VYFAGLLFPPLRPCASVQLSVSSFSVVVPMYGTAMFIRYRPIPCQLLNIQGVGGVRQIEIHIAEPFVPYPSASEVEVAVGKLKMYKSRGAE
jgi:hypothetical protein